ncbi:hypothetical protein D3C78_781440 [compost metagenome]
MIVSGKSDAETMIDEIMRECHQCNEEGLLAPDEAPYLGKYDEFVAPELIRQAFAADGLDLKGLRKSLM